MTKLTFSRRDSSRYSKLGKGRKKKQKWRRPTGRDNKMRDNRRGYSSVVSVGHKKSKIEKKKPILVKTIKDLEKIKENEIAFLGKIGMKMKMKIVKEANQKKINFSNLNVKKLIKKTQKKKENKK